ncbi:MAG TPA: cytochrome c [Candidatus Eisenbacteria bacterium]|nr:cytochrome c [Candidatus Eisenbacteria bacterium]
MKRIAQYATLLASLSAFALLNTACSPAASAERGQELFDLHCALCHEGLTPDLKKQPPRLENLFATKQLPSGAPATDAQVRKTIVEGLRTMPAFDKRLNDQELNDLVAYLHTLK